MPWEYIAANETKKLTIATVGKALKHTLLLVWQGQQIYPEKWSEKKTIIISWNVLSITSNECNVGFDSKFWSGALKVRADGGIIMQQMKQLELQEKLG